MPGPSRHPTARPPAGSGADREATIESLLLTGLDLYFSGQHERAVQTWTRVLFLDRGHARARAYIDRARRVIAERQREADELLHGGVAAFDAGDPARARALLTSLLQRGGADDLALALLERLDRLDTAHAAAGEASFTLDEVSLPAIDPPARLATGRRANYFLLAAAGVCLLLAVALTASWDRFTAWWQDEPARAPEAAVAVEPDALPLPSASELLLAQARALVARGHLHEALRAIDDVRLEDARRPEADRLRAEIQQALLASTSVSNAPGEAAPAARSGSDRP